MERPLMSGVNSSIVLSASSIGVALKIPLDRLVWTGDGGEIVGGLWALSGSFDGGGISGGAKDTLSLFLSVGKLGCGQDSTVPTVRAENQMNQRRNVEETIN